jgi:hypothetical protein
MEKPRQLQRDMMGKENKKKGELESNRKVKLSVGCVRIT